MNLHSTYMYVYALFRNVPYALTLHVSSLSFVSIKLCSVLFMIDITSI